MSFCPLGLRLVEHLAVLGLGLGELCLDAFRVRLPFGDAAAAFLQHVDDRLESVGLQDVENDEKRQRLADEGRPVEAENLRDRFFGGEKI